MKLSPLEAALRLSQSLARAEDALERRVEAERTLATRDIELQAVSDDRSRLARELDDAFARMHRLEEANRDVSRRLADAVNRIHSLLQSDEG